MFICAVLRRGEYRRQERIVFELRGRKRAWWSASAGTSLRPVVQDGVTAAEAPLTSCQLDVAIKMGGSDSFRCHGEEMGAPVTGFRIGFS